MIVPSAVSKWEVRLDNGATGGPPQDEFGRGFGVSEVPRLGSAAMLVLICTLESNGLTTSQGNQLRRLNVNRRLRFYLRPLRLAQEASLVVDLRTFDQTLGSKFKVVATPVENSETVLLKQGDPDRDRYNTASAFNAIVSGKIMTFTLFNKSDQLMRVYMPNDLEFRQLCEDSFKRFVQLETGYQGAAASSSCAAG